MTSITPVDRRLVEDRGQRRRHTLDVLALVVGRQADDEHAHIIAV